MPGTQRDIPYLEDKFQTGDIPTQQDFYDLFASYLHYLQVKQVAGASTSDVMSQKAVSDLFTALKDSVPSAGDTLNKLYNLITATGRPRGGFDASSGAVPTPTADNEAGDFWRITVAGTIGTMVLKPGDVLFASIDDAAVAADFYAVQSNVDQASDTVLGLIKLYLDLTALNVDGAPTQNAVVKGIQTPAVAAATLSGTNTYTGSVSPAISSYVTNAIFFLKFTNGNTAAAPTVNMNGLGAKTLKLGTNNVPSGFILSGQIYAVMYDGTDLQMLTFLGLSITAAELAAIPAGETNLFTVSKSIDGLTITYGAGVQQIDNFAPAGLMTLLADTAAWIGDSVTLTGDNRLGALGVSAQEFVITNSYGTIYKCVSHVIGTTAVNGSAVWIRTRSRDNLDPTPDAAIITALTTEAGWDVVNNTKTISNRSRVGGWYTSTSGYTYFCYGEVAGSSWSWRRIGQPDTIFVQITDSALMTELQNNDWGATPLFTPVGSVKGEDRQEHYWVDSNGRSQLAKCLDISGTKRWIKFVHPYDILKKIYISDT